MKISTKGRYSLMLLLDLAERQSEGFVALKDISLRLGISKKYLEQLVPRLSGVLQANRGPKGGYMLARPPEACTVGEVLRLTEGELCPVPPQEDNPLWQGLRQAVNNYLNSVTLQDLLDQKSQSNADNYHI